MPTLFKPSTKTGKEKRKAKRKKSQSRSGSEVDSDNERGISRKRPRKGKSTPDSSLEDVLPHDGEILLDDGKEEALSPKELISLRDLEMYKNRDAALQAARIGLSSQRIKLRNLTVLVGTGRIAVRPLDTKHVSRLKESMKEHIYEHLLNFRAYVHPDDGVDTTKKQVVKKLLEEIEAGVRPIYLISGLHRISALKDICPEMEITIQIYDANRMNHAAAQYIAARDNKALPVELRKAHKPMSFKDEAHSVRSQLMVAYDVCSSGNTDKFLPGEYFTEPAPVDDCDKTRVRLLTGYNNKSQSSLAGVTVLQFKRRFHREIRGALMEVKEDLADHVRTMKVLAFLSEDDFQTAMKFHDMLEGGSIAIGNAKTTIRAVFVTLFTKVVLPRNLVFGMQMIRSILEVGEIKDYDRLKKICVDFRKQKQVSLVAKGASNASTKKPENRAANPKNVRQKTNEENKDPTPDPSTVPSGSSRSTSKNISYASFFNPPRPPTPKPSAKKPKKVTATAEATLPSLPSNKTTPSTVPATSSSHDIQSLTSHDTRSSRKSGAAPKILSTPSVSSAPSSNSNTAPKPQSSNTVSTLEPAASAVNTKVQAEISPSVGYLLGLSSSTVSKPQTLSATSSEEEVSPPTSATLVQQTRCQEGSFSHTAPLKDMDAHHSDGEEENEENSTLFKEPTSQGSTPPYVQIITDDFWDLIIHFMNQSVDFRAPQRTRLSDNYEAYKKATAETKQIIKDGLDDAEFAKIFRFTKDEATADEAANPNKNTTKPEEEPANSEEEPAVSGEEAEDSEDEE